MPTSEQLMAACSDSREFNAAQMLINGYKIQEKIGHGGMACVYLAVQESLNRPVALKVLTHPDTPGFSERFIREARIIASLNHPNIIKIYDIGIDGGQHYLSMEYVTGGDLAGRIADRIPPLTALTLIEKIGGALQAAHDKGIVHRDVKPANILYRDDHTPLLMDFGIAKQAHRNKDLTVTGAIIGTPYYMSPEQAQSMPLDGRADLYSLGIVLYEMLAGRKPYRGDSDISIIFKHLHDPLPILPEAFQQFQPLLNKMIAKAREDRFDNLAEMIEYTQSLLQPAPAVIGETESGGAPSPATASNPVQEPIQDRRASYRLHPNHRRAIARWWPGIAVVSALGIVVGLLLSGGAPNDSVDISGEEPETVQAAKPLTASQPEQPAADPMQATENSADFPQVEDAQIPDARVAIEERSVLNTASRDRRTGPSADSAIRQPAAGEPREQTQDIKALLTLAEKRLAEYQLSTPKNDNALYYYNMARNLDPENFQARYGYRKVAASYARLAESALSRRRYYQAKKYIDLGLDVDSGNRDLKFLKGKVQVYLASQRVKTEAKKIVNDIKRKIQ